MRVSVVIPTYNRAAVVGGAVESVLAQRWRDLELLVVDDGSTDDTEARVGSVRDPRLRYVRRPHAGVSAARNAGVALATGPLIAFLDSDDRWKPDKLEREVDFLARYPGVHAVFSDLEKHDGEVFVPSFMRESPLFGRWLGEAAYPDGVVVPRRQMFLFLLQEVFVKPSALTLRRDAFVKTGGFDEAWSSSEDWDFLLRFAKGATFGYLDRPLAVLRLSTDSLHRVDQPRGETAMLRLLARERRALRGDREAVVAVQRGLRERVKSYAWYYDDAGRPLPAARVYLRGFRLTGDLRLLVRAAGVWVPQDVRRRLLDGARRAAGGGA
ncbi:MAG: glycosyltransferase family 2 protein, partial [Candidatus Rokuibacteriota bacterium]